MRSFNDPATAVMHAVKSFTDAVGSVVGGFAAEEQANAEAADIRQQARATRIAGARAVRDEKAEQRLRTARMLAIAGAGGRGADLLGAISRDEQESAIRQHRIQADTKARAQSLSVRSRNVREAGDTARSLGLFNAGSTLLTGGLKIKSLEPRPTGGGDYPTTPASRTNRTGRLSGPV